MPPSCLHQLQKLVFIPVVTEVLSQTRASLQPPVQTSQDHVIPGGLTVPELTCFPLLWYNKLKRSGVCLSSVHSTPRQSLEQQETVKNHLICTFKWKINKYTSELGRVLGFPVSQGTERGMAGRRVNRCSDLVS